MYILGINAYHGDAAAALIKDGRIDSDLPAWYEEILKEREQRVKAGQESFIDWEGAKGQLLKGCLREFVSRGECYQNPYRS